MPVRSVNVTDTYVEVDRGDGPQRFYYADFPPGSTNAQRLSLISDQIQKQWLDHRIRVSDLPEGAKGKDADPGLPHLFWEGSGNSKELVTRHVLLENVQYDPDGVVLDTEDGPKNIGVPLYFRLTRTR